MTLVTDPGTETPERPTVDPPREQLRSAASPWSGSGGARALPMVALAVGVATGAASLLGGEAALGGAVLVGGEALVVALAALVALDRRVPSAVVVPAVVVAGGLVGAASPPVGLLVAILAAATAVGLARRPTLGIAPTRAPRRAEDTIDLRDHHDLWDETPASRPVLGDASPSTGPSAATVVAGLTALAFALRLVAPRGLWLDELTSVHQARLPFGAMIDLLHTTDNHPPLHDVILWLQIRAIGDSELALRLPSMVIGAATVPILFRLGRELYDRRTGLIAAGLGAIAPVAVWYGQEARMYALFMFLAAVAVLAQVRVLRGGSRAAWAVFTVASAALVYTQYFAVLFVGALQLVFLVEIVRRHRTGDARPLLRPWLVSTVVLAMIVAPLVPFAADQFATNQDAGFGFDARSVATGSEVVPRPSAYTALTNVVWTLWGYQPDGVTTRLAALWPIGLLGVLVLLGRRRRLANRYLAFLALLPAAGIFAFSLFAADNRSLAEIRYFAGTAPLTMVLLAAAITTVATTSRARTLVTAGVVASMAMALVVQTVDRDNPRRYEYREAVEDIAAVARPGDRVVYSPHYLDYTMEYYSPRVRATSLDDGLPTDASGRIFLVGSANFADSAETREATNEAVAELSAERRLVAVREYRQMTVWEFA